MTKPLFVQVVSPEIWGISSSPWRWCLFHRLLKTVNNLYWQVGDPKVTAEELFSNFFDLSIDINTEQNRRIQWTIDGVKYDYLVDAGLGVDLPKAPRFFVPAGWCMQVIKYVEKGARWSEDVTPHPSGTYPNKRSVNVYAGAQTFNLTCIPNKGLVNRK